MFAFSIRGKPRPACVWAGVGYDFASGPLYAMTQGIGVATGLQDHFDWRGVVASAVGAGVGAGVRQGLTGTAFADAFGKAGVGFVSGAAASLTTAALHGGRVSAVQVFSDAFGNAVGSALADQSTSISGGGDAGAATSDGGTGDGGSTGSGGVNTGTVYSSGGSGSGGGSGGGGETNRLRLSSGSVNGVDAKTSPPDPELDAIAAELHAADNGPVPAGPAETIVTNGYTFDPKRSSMLYQSGNAYNYALGMNGETAIYGNGYVTTDADGNTAFHQGDTSGTVLSDKDFENVVSRDKYLTSKYDPNSFLDKVENFFTGAMDNPANILTDGERIEHEDLQNIISTNNDVRLNPERYSPLLQRMDAIYGSPLSAGAFLTAHAAGASQQTQDRVAITAAAASNVVTSLAMARTSGPGYMGARGMPEVPSGRTPLDQATIDNVLSTPKGTRPNPATYLSQDHIEAHLAEFKGGVTKFSASTPSGVVGPPGGTFVMPQGLADSLVEQAGGNTAKLEKLLGLDPGELGGSPVRIDIPSPSGLRMSNGNELGASGKWLPGGYTSGGIPEATINQARPGTYSVRPAF